MIANIFHPTFTLTITILACFVRKKQNCLGDLYPRFHQGIALDSLLAAPPDPQLQLFLALSRTETPIFFLYYPLLGLSISA